MSDTDQTPSPDQTPAQSPQAAAPAASPSPGEKAEPKAARKAKPVKFVSRDPDVKVLLGEGRDVQFSDGVALVTPEIAKVLEEHHLYRYDHISRADEVVRINGKFISFKGDAGFRDQVAEAREQNKVLFYFDAPRRTSIPLGDTTVVFEGHRALVDKKIAARLRNHRFSIEGRLTEIVAE